MPDTQALRVVGGPHDGAVFDAAPDVTLVQLGFVEPGKPVEATVLNGTDVVDQIKGAVYQRRSMAFEDGKTISFLCWVEMNDRQAMCHLLRIPYEE